MKVKILLTMLLVPIAIFAKEPIITTKCIKGQLFTVATMSDNSSGDVAVSIAQIFVKDKNRVYRYVPMKCDNKDKL